MRVGLVNNMPDAAYAATERQFEGLLREAADGTAVELVRFHFSATPRSELAAASLAVRSRPAADIATMALDAIVVTGAEPRLPRLDQEPYWPEFTALCDHVRRTGLPALWSCLATHAALLHVAGVERRRRDLKLSGVYSFAVNPDHPWSDDLPRSLRTPHSRWNALPVADLVAAGAEMLTASDHTGADAFTLPAMPGSLFLQGHPEYDADSLAREYRRDVNRYLAGEQAFMPDVPANLFDYGTETALRESAAAGADASLLGLLDELLAQPQPVAPWRSAAVAFYRQWLCHCVSHKSYIRGSHETEYTGQVQRPRRV